jgi:hypothetical protein
MKGKTQPKDRELGIKSLQSTVIGIKVYRNITMKYKQWANIIPVPVFCVGVTVPSSTVRVVPVLLVLQDQVQQGNII